MQKSSFDKWLVTLALLVVIVGAVLHFAKSNRAAQSQKQRQSRSESASFSPAPADKDFHPYYVPSVPRPTNKQPERNPGFEKLTRRKVEAWLAKHHRDAMSLLAAFRALNDTNYLNEAATNFPNNPQVELAVLARNEFPADRRKWLDLFKASSPGNSLANYLSAQDYLESSNTGAAVHELLAATGKTQLDAYNTESLLDAADLYSSSGDSPREADTLAMADMAKENLPILATYKRLARGIGDLTQQHLDSGDSSSAANLARIGMKLAGQIKSGDSGKYLINQLVGTAIESIVLEQWNPNTGYDFLGGKTPSQVRQENKQQAGALARTIRQFDHIFPSLTDDEMANYFKQVEDYGEVKAMIWLIQQNPPSNP
jgi:hypothetical protein